MSKEDGRSGKAFDVGYGKPPRGSRVQKGRSGNPAGRPRKRKKAAPLAILQVSQSDTILRRELDRSINLTDRDGTRKLSMHEAIRLAQIKSALGGSPIAQRHLLDAAGALEAREAARAVEAEGRRKEDFYNAVKWRRIRQRFWAAAEKEGREPVDAWPHPDDILIDERKMIWSIRGPINEKGCPLFRYYEAQRDQYIMMSELELRRPARAGYAKSGFLMLLVDRIDHLLPLRWQLSAYGEFLLLGLAMTDTRKIRRLLRECQEDVRHWHKIAYPAGERIELDDDLAKAVKPLVKKLGFRTIRDYERQLEQQSGNPPNPAVEMARKRLEDRRYDLLE